ncbi:MULTISPECIES: DUF4240 domain-containing protein [unclassified Streptomyces]|uniref:DUF4240 domain-containing protein n=1 Tax=unclassified Streptomyces TaxID=2593676 RepID=UPI00362504A2
MNEDAFWALIDELGSRPGTRDERLEWLEGELLRRPADESVAFQVRLEKACGTADTHALWRAANRIEGGHCTDDGFHYFTLWLVGQGRKAYEAVLADPDALADVPEVRALAGRHRDDWDDDEWPEWEELDYVAQDAYDELTGQEDDDGEEFLDAVEEAEEALGEEEGEEDEERGAAGPEGSALPRLTALFPLGESGS